MVSNNFRCLFSQFKNVQDVIYPKNRLNDLKVFANLLQGKGVGSDISVSRKRSVAKWGIQVPGDQEHLIYVWMDALTNYLTVQNYPLAEDYSNRMVHVVGKDILKYFFQKKLNFKLF